MKISLKDPGSAITHFLGIVFAILAMPPLLMRAAIWPDRTHLIALSVFITSMLMLYSASTIYHSVDRSEKVNRVLRKMDHIMIFYLIAGSYTPICLIVLKGTFGLVLLSVVWGIAILGTFIKALWITCPKWFSSVLYIAMGWVVVIAFGPILHTMPAQGIFWLVAGGVLYTIGGVIYAVVAKTFNDRHPNFGTHEIFHLFVLAGSICHFIMMYSYVALMP
ncbi:MAG: hemolysin III family protein [Lachnospiraceae bacterium]|nr:hemolysin III family protein [Lachnospiraceae bacterium]